MGVYPEILSPQMALFKPLLILKPLSEEKFQKPLLIR